MADWSGTSRTNYVRIHDKEGLLASISPFDIDLHKHEQNDEFFMFSGGSSDEGGWPSSALVNGDEVQFSFEEHVMPFVAEEEVLVAQCCGAEKLRYVTGYSEALVRRGDVVKKASVSMNEIYARAAREFGVDKETITPAEYMSLPASAALRQAPRG